MSWNGLHSTGITHGYTVMARLPRLSAYIIAIAALVVVVAACAPQERAAQPASQPASVGEQKEAPVKRGGIMVQASSCTAASLDAISEGAGCALWVTMPLYNTLLEYEYDKGDNPGFPSKIVPALAERWEQSLDGTVFTLHLRKGVKWHDGKEFTSTDAKFSIERIMEPPPKTPSLRQGWYKGVVTKMETPDPYTFVITIKEPSAVFLKLIAAGYTPMVPKHVLEPFNSRIPTTAVDKVIGTGPYKMVKAERDVGYELRKNEQYWKEGLPYLDGIDIAVILEETTRAAAFKSGRADLMLIGAVPGRSTRDSLLKDMGNQATLYTYGTVGGLGGGLFFNTLKKPFDDVRVRKAILMATDWRPIEKIAFQGESCVGGYMHPGGQWGASCADVAKRQGYRTPNEVDKREAKRLLAEAGYPNGFETKALMGNSPSSDSAMQLIQPMLAEIGVQVTFRNLERTAYYNAMNTGDFEMNSLGGLASVDDPSDHIAQWVICAGGRNYGKYCDPKVEEMFQRQSREPDFEKRKKIYRELEEYLLDQVPMVKTWSDGKELSRSYVKGYVPMGGRHSQTLLDKVWLDK